MTTTADLTSHSLAAISIIGFCLTGVIFAGDFDGDSFADLAIGVPFEDIGTNGSAGAVNTVYGSASGLSQIGQQFLHQDTANVNGACEATDLFGRALATGDFNGDGRYDLAIGVPSEDVGDISNAGLVNVLYGTAGGISTANDQLWTQETATISSTVEESDYFGAALAAGDFDGDGYDDLAIGSPYEDVGSISVRDAAGAVIVLWGSPSGLVNDGSPWWNATLCDGSTDSDDHFGWALAAGDFDNDGYDDLVIGSPGDEVSGHSGAGSISVLFGDSTGLQNFSSVNQYFHQDRGGIDGAAEEEDNFGDALTAGDFNGDGYDDLAVGAKGEAIGTDDNAGAVNILYGSWLGLLTSGDAMFHQNNFNAGSIAEPNDYFGASLTAGDFNGDGYTDLAVGVPEEDWTVLGTPTANVGMVDVLWGSNLGLNGDNAQWFTEDELTNGGSREFNDRFGFALAAGDFNNDGRDDLAASSPYDDLFSSDDAGAVYVLYGTDTDLDTNNVYFDQCTGATPGDCETGDAFGLALVSVPRKDHLFSDGFETNDLSNWVVVD